MREIELWAAAGFVAIVDLPPFPDRGMPKVVIWGDRTFRLDDHRLQVFRWRYDECFSVVSLTPSPGRTLDASDGRCRGCGKPILPDNYKIADGCPCNTPRGVNHGLVAKDTCTCTECDPAQTGSTRYPPLPEPPPPPVDRSARCTVGEALAPGVANTEDRGDGQQKGYVILCAEERAKGFVRPVRRTYRHLKCGTTTTMGIALSETYARDPSFYSGTFCCACGAHFPVGANGEFVWEGTDEKVGT